MTQPDPDLEGGIWIHLSPAGQVQLTINLPKKLHEPPMAHYVFLSAEQAKDLGTKLFSMGVQAEELETTEGP